MKKKQPTIADLMKKLEELEREIKALKATNGTTIYYHYHYQPPYYYQPYPVQPWQPYTITVAAADTGTASAYWTANGSTGITIT